MRHPIPRLQPDLRGYPCVHFQHGEGGGAGGDGALRHGLRIGGHAGDSPVAADEDHVEGDIGVLHPHEHGLFGLEIEQHAPVGGHEAAEHEAARALLIRAHDLDGERVTAAGGHDLKGLGGGGLGLGRALGLG